MCKKKEREISKNNENYVNPSYCAVSPKCFECPYLIQFFYLYIRQPSNYTFKSA